MIRYSQRDGVLTFAVRVMPRASRSEVDGAHEGALRVRIAAPPVDDAANLELIRLLAKIFRLPRQAVEIVAGAKSKNKVVRIHGADPAKLEHLSVTN